MSDFTQSARCPGCGGQFAPDDGWCCAPCEGEDCESWDTSQLEIGGEIRYYCENCAPSRVDCEECGALSGQAWTDGDDWAYLCEHCAGAYGYHKKGRVR